VGTRRPRDPLDVAHARVAFARKHRLAIEEDHDGIAQLVPLLYDTKMLQLLEQLQRDRPPKPASASEADWLGADTASGVSGTVH
jgi:hypothetical protein